MKSKQGKEIIIQDKSISKLKTEFQNKQSSRLQVLQSQNSQLFLLSDTKKLQQQQLMVNVKLIKKSPQQIANSLVNQVAQTICKQIEKQEIKINSYSVHLNKPVDKNQDKQPSKQDIKKQYQNIIKKKEQAIKQLNQLQYQQQQLKLTLKDKDKEKSLKKKYEMSQAQKERWHNFKILQKLHQTQFIKKKKIFQDQSKKFRQEELKLQEQRYKQKSQEKRKILSLKIAQIQQRHQERTFHHQQEQKIIQKLKNKKKLFQKMEEQFLLNKDKQQTDHYQKYMTQYKNKRKVDMNSLKNHQKHHQQHLYQQQVQRQRRMSQLFDKNPFIFHSRFLQNVLQQDQNKKNQQIQKVNHLKELYQKRRDYGKIVNQKFKPPKKIQNQNQKREMKTCRSMSAFDIQQKGNQYMKKVNQSLSNLKQKLKLNQGKKQPNQEVFKYKDYLKQLKIRQGSQSSQNKQRKNKQIQLIQNIMKKQNMTQQAKIHQARFVAQKIQGKGPKRVLDSINAKIQILKKLAP